MRSTQATLDAALRRRRVNSSSSSRWMATCLLAAVGIGVAVNLAAQNRAESAPDPCADFQELDRTLAFLRERNARDYALSTAAGIDEARFVEVGGIQQWITIRGEDRKNPVLLFLHGGPGDATNPWGYAAFRSWQRSFTIVQWDQRGAGRTLGRSGRSSVQSLSLDRAVKDGIELSEMLRGQLNKDKIVLVGHSYGSILGALMAKSRPDLFHAFVGTGQVVDPAKNYTVAYDALLDHAKRVGNSRAVSELETVGRPPYANGRGFAVQRKWSNQFEGADAFLASAFGLASSAPGYSTRDINDWLDGQGSSAERLVPETSRLPARVIGGEFALPVFVFQGAEDFTTPTSLAKRYVRSLHAPRKAFVAIDGGGHFAVFMKSEVFLKELLKRVLPLTRVP